MTGYGSCICLFYRLVQPVTIVPLDWFMYTCIFVLQACATGFYSSAGSCICLFYRLVQPVTIVPLVHVYVYSTGLCDRLL